MKQAAKLLFWQSLYYNDYCVLNDSNAYIETDFILGNYMSLEICFKRTSDVNTGILTVGTYASGIYDYQDFRFFFNASSTMICDCGAGVNSSTSGARIAQNVDDKTNWHICKFPTLINGNAKGILDGNVIEYTENGGIRYDGNFGVKSNPLTFFSNSQTNASQQIAIRYVNIWKFNSDELLASFWPDKKSNGIIDLISQKSYVPATGEVKIVKWKTL